MMIMPGIVPPASQCVSRIIECISESQVLRIPATPAEASSPFNNLAAHGPPAGIAQYCTLYCHGNAGRRPLTHQRLALRWGPRRPTGLTESG